MVYILLPFYLVNGLALIRFLKTNNEQIKKKQNIKIKRDV